MPARHETRAARRAGRGACFPAPCLLLLLFGLALLLRPAAAQLPYPLQGSALPAPAGSGLAGGAGGSGKVYVNVTALLERVYAMGADTSTYSAMWWLILTWSDPAAGDAVTQRTAQVLSGSDACNKSCDYSGLATAGCCDTIWLPHIELLNIVTYDDSQLPRYRINANASSGVVTWSTRLVGTWYAPFDFRAYPFEHQHLLLEMSIASYQAQDAGLVWQHVAKLNNTAHTKGADLAGWFVNWGKGKIYDSRTCMKEAGVAEPSYALAPASAAPGAPPRSAVYQSVTVGDRYVPPNPGRGTTTPPGGWCGTYAPHLYDEARALYGPIVLVADIMIKRVSSYYVLTNLTPVLLITLVAFVVFFMPQDALGDRMSVVLTMFLSLTAMQFVFDFPPANYINALQIVVLVSYIMISIACIESLVVNRIATVNRAVSNKRTCMRKYGQMLAKGGIARDAKFAGGGGGGGKSHNSIAGGGGAGGGRASARHPAGGGGGGLLGGMRRAPSVRSPADGPAGGAPGDVECGRADSALEVQQQAAQHLTFSPYANMTSRSLPRPGRGAAAAAPAATPPRSRLAAAAVGSPLRSTSNGIHHANSSAAGSASEREDVFPEDPPAIAAAPVPQVAEPTAAAAVAAGAAFAGGASFAASPFASARNAPSFAAGSDAGGQGGGGGAQDDRRSDTGSTTMSSTTTGRGRLVSWRRRCGAACCGPRGSLLAAVRALGAALAAWLAAFWRAPRQFYQQCKEDRAFAEFIAARIDKWACIVCAVAYVVVISVMLWFEVQVGDHRLMLGDHPGNM
ncbi:hypothetical protein HXX76_005776 [Chlamydomonas incerta]|uniref:Ligand-gated ion channel n=1 Tax=Chlamydomonas incerta TaxID=51695 RepID=A0A835TD51_CHLIN|nr:hypothetical protein HXX76_005776 [Chlamydomonas incerta]|eukprot:KAG2438169.1 hypothetical protein HXX76_005776 [Chlamydomonas incerta]